VLCEYLASHGYVVLGSAFQHASGKSFNVDSKEGSARDFEFLIAYAHNLANVDWDHIGVVGHSGGAHAALFFRSQGNSVVDAVVSLDTTQDYYSLADPRWQYLTDAVGNNRDNMTGPLLMVANPHAFFQMADSLKSARRYYFTIKGLDHNDFISQGGIHKDLQYRRRFGDGAKGEERPAKDVEAKEKAELDAVRAGYKALCIYVLRYFDAYLKGDAAGKDFLAKQHRDTKLGGADPHVEYVPEGTTGPDPYKGNEDVPPTPRQLRLFLREHGVEKTVALLNRFQKTEPTPPVLSPIFGFALIYELLDQRKNEDAIAFRNAYREGGTDIVCKMLMSHGDLYMRLGSKKWAADFFKKVLALDPDNAEAAKKLKELEK
jgi:pimeloyl-ACP methyl ester carboxylesterase